MTMDPIAERFPVIRGAYAVQMDCHVGGWPDIVLCGGDVLWAFGVSNERGHEYFYLHNTLKARHQ